MPVYKKTYRRYDGPLTRASSRCLIIPRYAFEDMRRRRFLSLFFLAAMICPLVFAFLIYVNQNLNFLKLLPGPARESLFTVGSTFFLTFLGIQSMFAFFLTAFVGPGLISPDLAHNALPLYLARPFTRREYVAGKLLVLVALLSAMTWIPGLLLFLLHGTLAGNRWIGDNLRIAAGLFFGAWLWITVLSLLALALSAWVKWKPAAGGLLLAIFFVSAGWAAAVNAVLRTRWGHLMNLKMLIGSIWAWLFETAATRGTGAVFFRVPRGEEIPLWSCALVLGLLSGLCLFLLMRRIKAAEVVRS